ncbi:uncharacterized protein EDB93DRAFT_1257529 [Suillus bovinus]|uniref:uncharacterized protein n=1 Tax=Suillus bovinus TaxID=48563 RepID=UPI001B870027|nr:uncharacterized protein EDB93DRAFT_1257529 [Suillus bovinus]KAG2126380.1 hypothetical protein EDB93DRAFT_1257529 [Suillus bovinus]
MTTTSLKVFCHDDKVYTSLTADSLPEAIPHWPAWDLHDTHDSLPDDSDTPLTTCWAYAARPWLPLVPLNPDFDGPIFACLNYSAFLLRVEVDRQGEYILHRDIRGKWHNLEQKLLWCQDHLGAGLLVPWGTLFAHAPTSYGYQRSHADARLAKKVALRPHNTFSSIVAICTWHIMSCQYQGSDHAWVSLLTDDPMYPIPAEWVLELSHSFVGDFLTNVPHTGVFISSIHCPWEAQLPMFEAFSIPIWVSYDGNTAVDIKLHHYIPSPKAIANVIEAQQSGQMHETFPVSEQLSGQKPGEQYNVFFTQHHKENKVKEAKETPARWQSRQSSEHSAMSHSIPRKSNMATVFEWQPQDKFDGFLLRICLTKAQISTTWENYSRSTRIYDSFHNEWDLCDVLHPTSIPDGDWEEDHFLPVPTPSGPPLPPPPLSSFIQDIENYFGHHEVAPSLNYTSGIEHFTSILHFHLGFQLTASTHTARDRSTMFEQWIQRTTWINLCKLIGNSGDDIESVADTQKHVITCFIGYLVTLPSSQLSHIPSDLWDLGPDSSLSASNANIQVSYIHVSEQQLLYVIQLCPSPSLVPWKLVVPDTATALMCLHHDLGYDIMEIARNLLQKGIAFKTLQPIAVLPCAQRPVMELHTYSLGYKPPTFSTVYADYVMYKQYCHEFMNQPHARAALLHGGLVWQLALHSIGFDALPSVLDGISQEAVPFGLMLSIDGQTYFDDELLLEVVDFICGIPDETEIATGGYTVEDFSFNADLELARSRSLEDLMPVLSVSTTMSSSPLVTPSSQLPAMRTISKDPKSVTQPSGKSSAKAKAQSRPQRTTHMNETWYGTYKHSGQLTEQMEKDRQCAADELAIKHAIDVMWWDKDRQPPVILSLQGSDGPESDIPT